jgi:hypothetical protein
MEVITEESSMKFRISAALCACVFAFGISTSANAAFYDFQQWVTDNSEQGFDNSSPFTLTVDSLILTAKAKESPGSIDSHVYLDDTFNGIIGGMGVCSTLDAGNQCTPSSDDNVSIDGSNGERLIWKFDQKISEITLELGDSEHFAFNSDFQYKYDGDPWTTTATDVNGNVTLAFDGSSKTIRFRPVAAGLTNQFYIRNADVSAVPVPAAVWLFSTGLLGLVGVARRS